MDAFGISDNRQPNPDYVDLLRKRLAGSRPPADPLAVESRGVFGKLPAALRPPDSETRLAAVLLPVMLRRPVPTLLFTRRTENLPDHPGQISFPGGGREPQDADAVATALRETEEEVGLPPRLVEPIGFLEPYLTTSGFSVTPVVGLVDAAGELKLNHQEVAEAFEVPLDFILDAAHFERRGHIYRGHRVSYYVVHYGRHRIWGATAAMLAGFRQLLTAAPLAAPQPGDDA